MRVSYAQRWRLRQMGRSMSRSDPHLTAMLMIFARLTAGEAIASIEQTGFRHTRAWRNLAGMNPPGGPLVDDITYSSADGPSVFTHPLSLNTWRNGIFIGDEQPASGY